MVWCVVTSGVDGSVVVWEVLVKSVVSESTVDVRLVDVVVRGEVVCTCVVLSVVLCGDV